MLPILRWLLRQLDPAHAWDARWCDLSRLRRRPSKLPDRLKYAVELYPCDILFVHRDRELGSVEGRLGEITTAATSIAVPHVPVIPVRMTEAWLLFDPASIRMVAGNPNGRMAISLPKISEVEFEADPKERLFSAIRSASGLTGRRLEKVRPEERRHQLAEAIDDYSPLRQVPSFARFECATRECLQALEGSGGA